MNFYQLFKFWAFQMDPEAVHHFSIHTLKRFPKLLSNFSGVEEADECLALKVAGLKFPSPIGLAAGLDKNGEAIDFFTRLPFGFVEVGTVTPRPQEGNPKPRLFRYPAEESLRNCMGFNNEGSDRVHELILKSQRNGKPVGINLGKNKDTPAQKAHEDYTHLYKKFVGIADYLVVNVSSPNTPGLRDLQAEDGLRGILEALSEVQGNSAPPLFVKLAPDQDFPEIDKMIDIAFQYKVAGLIATNTTIMPERGPGGISGKLLLPKARKVRGHVLKRLKDDYPEKVCIGVGGISSFDDLWDFWLQGGKLAQLYTAFIYQGPQLLKEINRKIKSTLELNQVRTLEELLANITEAKKTSS